MSDLQTRKSTSLLHHIQVHLSYCSRDIAMSNLVVEDHLTSEPTQIYIPLHGPKVVNIPQHLHFFLDSNFFYDHHLCTSQSLVQLFKIFYPDSYIGSQVTREFLKTYFELLVYPFILKSRDEFNYETNTMVLKKLSD